MKAETLYEMAETVRERADILSTNVEALRALAHNLESKADELHESELKEKGIVLPTAPIDRIEQYFCQPKQEQFQIGERKMLEIEYDGKSDCRFLQLVVDIPRPIYAIHQIMVGPTKVLVGDPVDSVMFGPNVYGGRINTPMIRKGTKLQLDIERMPDAGPQVVFKLQAVSNQAPSATDFREAFMRNLKR